jgi:hypothetical protein
VLAKQVLYYLSHAASSFPMIIFKIRACFVPRLVLTVTLLFVLPHVRG